MIPGFSFQKMGPLSVHLLHNWPFGLVNSTAFAGTVHGHQVGKSSLFSLSMNDEALCYGHHLDTGICPTFRTCSGHVFRMPALCWTSWGNLSCAINLRSVRQEVDVSQPVELDGTLCFVNKRKSGSKALSSYAVKYTHAQRDRICCHNTDLVNGHDRIILVIFSQALYKAPWWWILCDPKHVGALLNIL